MRVQLVFDWGDGLGLSLPERKSQLGILDSDRHVLRED